MRPWSNQTFLSAAHATADSRKVSIEVFSHPPAFGYLGTPGSFCSASAHVALGNQRFNKFQERLFVRDALKHVVKFFCRVHEHKPIIWRSSPDRRRNRPCGYWMDLRR